MGSPEHAVEIIRNKKWTVRVTAYGNTLTFPFEAESYARSYADGQAFRLGVEVAERKSACGAVLQLRVERVARLAVQPAAGGMSVRERSSLERSPDGR